ncbi:MAG: hypothetical protein Kow00133_15890 [Amphiplicatus sp.]
MTDFVDAYRRYRAGEDFNLGLNMAAELAGVPVSELREAVEAGELPAQRVRDGGPSVVYPGMTAPEPPVYRVRSTDLRAWATAGPQLTVEVGGERLTYEGEEARLADELLRAGGDGILIEARAAERAATARRVIHRLAAAGAEVRHGGSGLHPSLDHAAIRGGVTVIERRGLARRLPGRAAG